MTDDKNDSQKPKIIVDDDWKAQARADKEKLAESAKTGKTDKADPQAPRELPPANFETLLSTTATQAMFVLGMIPDPRSGQRYVDLDLAKHHIDMLAVLDEKTAGNLDEQEKSLLDQTLHELRMQFVQLSQQGISRGVLAAPGDAPPGDAPPGDAPPGDAPAGEPQA